MCLGGLRLSHSELSGCQGPDVLELPHYNTLTWLVPALKSGMTRGGEIFRAAWTPLTIMTSGQFERQQRKFSLTFLD